MAARWDTGLLHDRMVVTGGGSGIGRALSLELADRGVTAYIIGRREQALKETVGLAEGKPGRLIPLSCDLKDAAAVDETFKRIEQEGGPVRAVAHCAASVRYEPAVELTFETFSAVVGTTLFTAFNTLHRWAMALIHANLDGVAVAITSPNPVMGQAGIAHSAAGKSGIEAFVRSVASEWKPFGIRINCVGPGIFPVEKSKEMWDRLASERAAAGGFVDRYGELSEIVGPLMFMLTEAAGFINGAKLTVDGGPPHHSGPPKRYTVDEDPGTRP
jgi:NAD(P)-dependent dehydrogenase (short-subunit alcohol dehydrogenase family)